MCNYIVQIWSKGFIRILKTDKIKNQNTLIELNGQKIEESFTNKSVPNWSILNTLIKFNKLWSISILFQFYHQKSSIYTFITFASFCFHFSLVPFSLIFFPFHCHCIQKNHHPSLLHINVNIFTSITVYVYL